MDAKKNDTISRQDAINKFEPWLKVEGYSEGELNMLKAVLYELTVMPTAQPDWIPVTDRLPEDDTEVIVSCTDDSGDSEFSYTTTGWHFKGLWVVGNERSYFVRAWMPLPKSYSERRQDK